MTKELKLREKVRSVILDAWNSDTGCALVEGHPAMTALERAARAIQDEIERQVAEKGYLGWGSGQAERRPSLGKTYVDGDLDVSALARTVMIAVREPDDAGFMAEAMNLDGPLSRGVISAPEFFTAMIDAILNEKDTNND